MLLEATEENIEVFNILKENNPDFISLSSPEEIKETIEYIISRKKKEIDCLIAAGVLRYEAEYEASKLNRMDTPYSILTEYLTEVHLVDVDIFSEDYIDKAISFSQNYKDLLMDREFDDTTFQMELEMAFKN